MGAKNQKPVLRRLKLYVVEIEYNGQHVEFFRATLDRDYALRLAASYDSIAKPEGRAIVHPISAAIRTARAKSRSA